MLVLAIDTATQAVTAGVIELPDRGPPAELARRVVVDARAHAEQLTPLVLAAVADAGTTLSATDAIVCGAGPGPFTGLRVDGPHVQRPGDVPTAGYAAVAGPTPHAELLGLPVRGPEHPGPVGLVAVAAGALRSGASPAPLAPYRPDAAEPRARKPVSHR